MTADNQTTCTEVRAIRPRDTEAQCPKCRSRDFKVTYVDECELSNEVRDGRWMGTFEQSALPSRLSAHGDCKKCKHAWKFRNGYID